MVKTYQVKATGHELRAGRPFQLHGNSYPQNWLELASPEDLAAHGIEAIELPDPDPPVQEPEPVVVTRRQLMLAALELGLLDAMETLVPSLPRAAQIEWHHATVYERSHPMWDAAAAMIMKTTSDVDALFALAKTK